MQDGAVAFLKLVAVSQHTAIMTIWVLRATMLVWLGFIGVGNGCNNGNKGTQDPVAKKKICLFESGCGGRETYKCY